MASILTDMNTKIQEARALLDLGDYQGALSLCEELRRDNVRDDSVFEICAKSALSLEQTETAYSLVQQGLEFTPFSPVLHFLKFQALLTLGRNPAERSESLVIAQRACDYDARARAEMIAFHLQQGMLREAGRLIDLAEREQELPPRVAIQKSEHLYLTHRFDEALSLCRRVEMDFGLSPHLICVLRATGEAIDDGKIVEQCESHLTSFSKPAQAEALTRWSEYKALKLDYGAAVDFLKRAFDLHPTQKTCELMAKFALSMGRSEEANTAIRYLLEQNPNAAQYRTLAARQSFQHGASEAAVTHLEAAIASNPLDADAYLLLSQIDPRKISNAATENLNTILRASRASTDRMKAFFTLGRFHDAGGRFDDAFSCFKSGNELYKELLSKSGYAYDRSLVESVLTDVRSTRSADGSLDKYDSIDGPQFIFIVGLPRSGTSLVEQVLSSAPGVFGAGEHPEMMLIANDVRRDGRELGTDRIQELRRRYIESHQDLPLGVRYITDKLPQNFLNTGLITKLFPEAKIIWIQRNPEDVALSIFQLIFNRTATYANSLDDLAHHTAIHDAALAHSREHISKNILCMTYETVVADPIPHLKGMCAFCGLEWSDALLEFHKTDRAVFTHSAAQVRKPLYRTSVNRSAPYSEYLSEFTAKLARYRDALGVSRSAGK